MTIAEIVNAHKFQSAAVGKLCRDAVNNGKVDSADYSKEELDEMLADLVKKASSWAKSNATNGAAAKNRREAEKRAKETWAKCGGKNVRPDLSAELRTEYDNAVIVLRALGYDV